MHPLKKKLALLVISMLVVGCISFTGMRNTQYALDVTPPVDPNSRVVNICRPSALYGSLSYVGLYVNDEPALELGSGEKYQFFIPNTQAVLHFVIPTRWFKGKANDFMISLSKSDAPAYIVFGVAHGGSESSNFGTYEVTTYRTNWTARQVSRSQYENECGTKPPRVVVDNALLSGVKKQ